MEAEPSFVALTEACGLLTSTLPSAVAETLPTGALDRDIAFVIDGDADARSLDGDG